MRYYIAGPMRGYPNYNFESFNRVAKMLRERGDEVVNPAELDVECDSFDPTGGEEQVKNQRHYARRDASAIIGIGKFLGCTAIYLLKGWTQSTGARAEAALAKWIGLHFELEDPNETTAVLETDVMQHDPNGKEAHEPGAKLDADKPMMYLLKDFGRALYEVAKVASFGATKYSPHGWIKVPNGQNRYTSAMLRHFFTNDEFDGESGLLHDAQVAWNALARLELKLRGETNA